MLPLYFCFCFKFINFKSLKSRNLAKNLEKPGGSNEPLLPQR